MPRSDSASSEVNKSNCSETALDDFVMVELVSVNEWSVLFNDALNTLRPFCIVDYRIIFCQKLYSTFKLITIRRKLFYSGIFFYLTTHSTHFIYGYMASDIWWRTIQIVREETRCRHMGYSFRVTARVLLYAPSHRQDSTYHSLCYTSRGALAGTRNSSMGPPHEGSIRRPTAPWTNALTTELHLAPTAGE